MQILGLALKVQKVMGLLPFFDKYGQRSKRTKAKELAVNRTPQVDQPENDDVSDCWFV